MGGGGAVSPETMAICRRGIRNVLVHLGVLPESDGEQQPAAPRYSLPGTRAYVFAVSDGVFEPFHGNGDAVHAGEPAGRIWAPWAPDQAPATMRYEADGILYARRPIGRVRPGNCCAVVAQPLS
jgi:predicted deacylase